MNMKLTRYIVLVFALTFVLGCKAKTEDKEALVLSDNYENSTSTMDARESINDESELETGLPENLSSNQQKVSAEVARTENNSVSSSETATTAKAIEVAEAKKEIHDDYKVYFLEIGSLSCIPCRMMQPIMDEVAKEYKGIVKVEFYDLMKDREIGPKYRIRVMPTQVFLDANKQEFFRHEGFYPKTELVKMLDTYLAKLPK